MVTPCVFRRINLSQQPDLSGLQKRLFEQIASEKMSRKEEGSVEFQIEALKNVAQGRCMLICLDDIWDKVRI